ncbi:hypothetical protein I4U23_015443 [Adineta vaga]|nr:hypothetical protein I4U23_015443 [Adineta vaga]
MYDGTDESDNDDDDDDSALIHQRPFPDYCQDETRGIESFSSCLMRHYHACPIFYTIRYVRILIDEYNLNSIMDWNEWNTLFPTC